MKLGRFREYVLHAVLVALLLVAVFPNAFLYGHMTTSAYVLYDFFPWKAYGFASDFPHDKAILTWEFLGQFTGWYKVAQQALEAGEWPLWNPYEHTGVPLLANYQSAVFYPPRILHSLIDLHLASTILILFKVWLCGMTAYIYGRGVRLSVNASRLLSVAWMLCMYNMTWTYWCEVDVAAWFPLQLLAVELLLNERLRRGFFLLCASASLMLLAGHPETAFTMSFGAGFSFVLRLALGWRQMHAPFRVPLIALGAWGVALGACMGQIAPFLEYLPNSFTLAERAGQEASEHALSATALVNFWVPRYYGITSTSSENYWGSWVNSNFNTVIYPGLAVWFGVFMLFARGRGANTTLRRRALCMALPAVFSLLAVFDHPVVQFIKQIPVLGSMWSIWWFAFPAMAIPVIAAHGFDHWTSVKRPYRDALAVALPGFVVSVACAALYIGFQREIHILQGNALTRYVQMQLVLAAVLLVIGVAILLIAKRRPAVISLMVVWLAVDLLIAGRGLRPTAPRDRVFPETALTTWAAEQSPPPRFALGSASSATIPDGVMQYYGIEDFLGYDGIYPKRIKHIRANVKLWNSIEPVFAVKYFLNLPELILFVPETVRDRFRLIDTIDGLQIYENTGAWPRARLVGGAKVIADEDAMFATLNDTQFDPAKTVLLEEPASLALPETSAEESGRVSVIGRTNNTVTLDATATAPCMLVLSDQYFSGWNAYVDGEKVPVQSAYYVFRAIALESGSHRVVFRYEPVSFRVGMMISSITLAVSALAALIALRRRPRAA